MRQLLKAVLGLILAAPMVEAQTVCRPRDNKGAMFETYMRQYVVNPTGDNEIARVKLGLPRITDSTTVKLVTAEQTCKKARDAYNANTSTTAPGSIAPSGRVYVVAIGNTYAVLDPVYRGGLPNGVSIQILDSRYKLMKTFF